MGVPAFYHPERFQRGGGLSQARPPFRLDFDINDTDDGSGHAIEFSFSTWHAEADRALARGEVATLYDLANQEGGHYVIGGDLNVNEGGLQGAVQDAITNARPRRLPTLRNKQEVHYYQNSLDFIISDQTVQDAAARVNLTDPAWEQLLKSGAHYALFGQARFNKEKKVINSSREATRLWQVIGVQLKISLNLSLDTYREAGGRTKKNQRFLGNFEGILQSDVPKGQEHSARGFNPAEHMALERGRLKGRQIKG